MIIWAFCNDSDFYEHLQLYELSDDVKRKEFLDELFSFMQKRGKQKVENMANCEEKFEDVPSFIPYKTIKIWANDHASSMKNWIQKRVNYPAWYISVGAPVKNL